MSGGDSKKTMFSSTPHFFKIIFHGTLRENKLHIPKKFTAKYGETLSNWVLIKLPCGSKWKMGLTKKDENIWFEKGWLDFAKHYGLKRGSMITFRYEGNSEFYAVIFDISTVEINYPCVPTNLVVSSIDSELKIQVVEKDSVDVLDEYSSPCSRPHKKTRTQSNPSCRKLESETKGEKDLHLSTEPQRCEIITPMKSLSGRDEALQQAIDFESRLPFFKVVMQPHYVHGHQMNLPYNFAKKYLGETCSNAVLKLSNGYGRTWFVEHKFGVYNKVPSSIFKAGWPVFAKDNNLKEGDICVFVMLEEMKFTFEVVIFRVSTTTNSNNLMSSEHKDSMDEKTVTPKPKKQQQPHFSVIERAKILERVQFKSEYPFFKIVIQPSSLNSRSSLGIPIEFVRRHLDKEGDAILSVSKGGGYWPIEIKTREMNTRADFKCGWNKFAKENDLKVGDVCIFELLKKSENLFRVSIFSADDDDAYNNKKCQVGASKPKVEVGEELAMI
ncbi:hypothetical protein CsatA_014099 [Cannabis sativa]